MSREFKGSVEKPTAGRAFRKPTDLMFAASRVALDFFINRETTS
jgi:hypothetical protein